MPFQSATPNFTTVALDTSLNNNNNSLNNHHHHHQNTYPTDPYGTVADHIAATVAAQRHQQATAYDMSAYRAGNKRLRTNDYRAASASLSPDAPAFANPPARSAYPISPQPGQFTMAYQPNHLAGIPTIPTFSSEPSYGSVPSLTDASTTSLFSPYSSDIQTDQSNGHCGNVQQTTNMQQSSASNGSYLTNVAPEADRRSAGLAGFPMPSYAEHFYSGADGFSPAPVQQPNLSESVSYSQPADWPNCQDASQQATYNAGQFNGTYHGTAELYGKDASLHIKLQSLAVLDNLATQIILSLAKPSSLVEIERIASNLGDDEERQAYRTRKELFDQTRKVYSRDSPFIDAAAVQLITSSHQEIIRKANRATFISSLLEPQDISFFDLNDYFLEVFVPPGQRLLKWQGAIYLELKTQIYISALLNGEGDATSLLDDLFPTDLEDRIVARHPDAPHLVPSEQDFVERARARKQYLQAEPASDAPHTLPHKYAWRDFLREFATSINKNVDTLLSPSHRSSSSSNESRNAYSRDDPTRRHSPPHGTRTSPGETRNHPQFGPLLGDQALTGPYPTPHAREQLASHASSPPLRRKRSPSSTDGGKTGVTGATSARQPWRQEEEDALLAGLEEVKGPYWSRILSMYGRGGSRSEVLKDRNQIQLKDKARNLKLWHLKMGNEVPVCLQGVTGELRKRGGAKVRAALGLDGDGPGAGAATGNGAGVTSRKASPKQAVDVSRG